LKVYYGGEAQRYACSGAFSHLAAALCISFGGLRVDRAIAKEVLDRLQPIGVEAALAAIDARGQQQSEKRKQLEFALQQARYNASRAQRQYDAIDPDNRLVADELERRWNERLIAVRDLEVEIDQLDAKTGQHLSDDGKRRLMCLGEELARAWDSSGATLETRKKIIRTVISEIVVDVVNDSVEMVVH
jgi:isopentenyl diphosphate isomerase/L-lactate dehydrogenase-like FMN-dependent dehydrogenase